MSYDHVVPREASRLSSLDVITREALAFARQASLLHRDVRSSVLPEAPEGDDVVVVLHGLFATAGVLRPMRRTIEAQAPAATATFTYAPGPGVDSVARRLAALVRTIEGDVRIHLVGHSLGGVIARWYVQELGADSRVVQTISLGSPFNGTSRARLLPAQAGRDIQPDSPLLARLRQSSAAAVPHVSVAAREDSLVLTQSAMLPQGERVLVEGCGHNALLYDRRVVALVVDRIRNSRGWM